MTAGLPVDADGASDVDWKAESRKWEARAKANKGAADELAALKAASPDGADLHARLTAAEADAAEARRELARHRVAAECAVPLDLVVGETEAEMRANAELILAWARPSRSNHAA